MSDAEVANLTMCPVCKQTYTEPSQLPCRDTLCKKCFFAVQTTPATADPKQQVRRCPLCSLESPASGSELRPDIRAAWIVRTRLASVERQKRETAKGRCSLPHCDEAAVGHGFYFEGSLCNSHVRTDVEKFTEIKLTAQSLLQSVRGLTQMRKDALADLQAERSDTAELFDAIDSRMQQCRKVTLGRLDTAIEKLRLELRAVEFIEKLQIEIQDAERVGDQVLSSRLFKQLHLSLADVDVKAGWASSADETVELAQHLLTTIATVAADVENGKGAAFIRSCVEQREPICQEIPSKGIVPLATADCSRTDGFYSSAETGVIANEPKEGLQPMPTRCLIAFGRKEASGYFAAAPNPRELLAQYFDVFGRFCGQFSLELSPGATLVSVECASQLQRLFLLSVLAPEQPSNAAVAPTAASATAPAAATAPDGASRTSATAAAFAPAAPISELTVTNLAGTRLHLVQDLQLGGPARSLTCCGDYLSSVSLYVLGAGQLACLSAETCQLQECVQLPKEVQEARGVAASGRRLVLVTARSAHLMSPATKAVTRLLSVGDKEAELRRVAAIGCGFAAVSDGSRWLCFVARSGCALKTLRVTAEPPSCVGRVEQSLRIFAMRTGK